MQAENEIYRTLQKHLDKLYVGYPETNSGVEIRVLKSLFSPKEALIASKLKMIPERSKQVYRRVKKFGLSREEVHNQLIEMDQNGLIFGKKKGKRKYYRNQIFAVGMYEFQVNRVTKDFMKNAVEYIDEGFAEELISTGIYQSRIIPVEKSISLNNQVCSYDDVRKLIENVSEPIAIAKCICRMGYDKLEIPCSQTNLRESCLIFQEPAKYYINHRFGRPIAKNNVFDILNQAEKDGLVLQAGNSRKMNFICTCCKCCCGALIAAKTSPHPSKLYKSNFYVTIDSESCTGCEMCVKRCQMDAMSIDNEIASVDLKKCVGCGLCVTTCPQNAIKLKNQKKNYKPPRSQYKLVLKILKKKSGRLAALKMIFNATFRTKIYYLLKRK